MNIRFLRHLVFALASLALACVASTADASPFAYLSVNGNDANPCTVRRPCRLLPAALAVVNDGGEIWMLNSANYNVSTVSITKSVSILAIPGALGSVVANGGDGISINAGTSNVTLRNLNVRQLGTPRTNNGISINAVGYLSVDSVVVENLNYGLYLTGAAVINIKDSVFRSNVWGINAQQFGGSVVISIDHSTFLENTTYAIGAATNNTSNSVQMTIDNSVFTGFGTFSGVLSFLGAISGAAPISASIAHTKVAGTGPSPAITYGIVSSGVNTVVTLADCHVSGFDVGLANISSGPIGPGVFRSLGNNFFVDNGGNTSVPLVSVPPL